MVLASGGGGSGAVSFEGRGGGSRLSLQRIFPPLQSVWPL